MPPSSRPRGAPPGNHNALKHGLYSRRLTPHHPSVGVTNGTPDLLDQLTIARVCARRLTASLDPTAGPGQLTSALRSLCIALTALTRPTMARHSLSCRTNAISAGLTLAIRLVIDDLRIAEARLRFLPIDPQPSPTPTPGSSSSSTPIS